MAAFVDAGNSIRKPSRLWRVPLQALHFLRNHKSIAAGAKAMKGKRRAA